MPTLLEIGKVVKQKRMSTVEKRKIDTLKGVDFLTEYIGDRIYQGVEKPKIRIRGIGSKVLVIKSGTGSGKSTLIPPWLYNTYLINGGNLIITQPTRATATSIPYDIAFWNPSINMGENIGFQTGTSKYKPAKGILFSTVGILLQYLKTMEDEQFMKKYAFIIIDEAHSRSLAVDSTLYYLKELLIRNWDNPKCPFIILMSATINEKIYMDYFKCPKDHFLEVVGATFPIEDHYLKFPASNYLGYAVDLAESLHINNTKDFTTEDRDILIFIQGRAQIKHIIKEFTKLNAQIFSQGVIESKKHSDTQMLKYTKIMGSNEPDPQYYVACVSLMSENISAGGKDYKNLFSKIESVDVDIYEIGSNGDPTDKIIKTVKASRRLFIGTNAIETGLTIDSLKYCIDLGWVTDVSFNPNYGAKLLTVKNVTRASSHQRRGRVGRKAPGTFYAVYTKESYEKFQDLPYPEIVKEDISEFLLDVIISETKTTVEQIPKKTDDAFQKNQFDQYWYKVVSAKAFSAGSIDFIQFPSSDSLNYSMEKLHGLGFIDHTYKPTIFGVYASNFRKVDLENIRMILAGYTHGGNILDLITIACFIQTGGTMNLGIRRNKYKPRNPLNLKDLNETKYYYRLLFGDDFIEYLFIWHDFMEVVGLVGKSVESAKNVLKLSATKGRLDEWALANKISLRGLYYVIDLRDEVILDMMNMGLNPYYNDSELPRGKYDLVKILNNNLYEGLEEVRKIKKCIYDGYRFNLCIWDDRCRSYVNNYRRYKVKSDSLLVKPIMGSDNIRQSNPQKIIISNPMLRSNPMRGGAYEFSSDNVSVLDGFIEPDLSFLLN